MIVTEFVDKARLGDWVTIERRPGGHQRPLTIEGILTGIRKSADRIDITSINGPVQAVNGNWSVYVTFEPWRTEIRLEGWDSITIND